MENSEGTQVRTKGHPMRHLKTEETWLLVYAAVVLTSALSWLYRLFMSH